MATGETKERGVGEPPPPEPLVCWAELPIFADMRLLPVVAAVIQRNGRVLICRRPAHKRHGGLWEFPGGKMHDGESIADAIHRELREELHVAPARVGRVRHAINDPGSPFLVQFVDVTITGEPRSTEHDAIAWVEPAQLWAYALAPSDRMCAALLPPILGHGELWPT